MRGKTRMRFAPNWQAQGMMKRASRGLCRTRCSAAIGRAIRCWLNKLTPYTLGMLMPSMSTRVRAGYELGRDSYDQWGELGKQLATRILPECARRIATHECSTAGLIAQVRRSSGETDPSQVLGASQQSVERPEELTPPSLHPEATTYLGDQPGSRAVVGRRCAVAQLGAKCRGELLASSPPMVVEFTPQIVPCTNTCAHRGRATYEGIRVSLFTARIARPDCR